MSAEIVHRELDLDLAILARAENSGERTFRVWSVEDPVVVIGRSVDAAIEVNTAFCSQNDIPIVARPSGGRSVLIGPGSLQYAFGAPYSLAPELESIAGSKRFCNRMLQAASPELAALTEDESGDLMRDDRKVAGLALKRGRSAMLLHGTILVSADLELIAQALHHPQREPAYRGGRAHREFLANLEKLDTRRLNDRVNELLAETAQS